MSDIEVHRQREGRLGATLAAGAAPEDGAQLIRSLRFWDIVLFGIICVNPIAPIPLYGILERLSRGHAATAIVLATLAMLPTAYSYGILAARYPVAGSAFTYVSRVLHPQFGFVVGWTTALDYLVIPIVAVIYCALTLHRVAPTIPYPVWAAGVASLCTFLNLRRVRKGVLTQQILLVFMAVVVVTTLVLALRHLVLAYGITGWLSVAPFYQPGTFDVRAIATATSFAALTYIGFDAVTTLAEEVEDPTRNLARATILVCLIAGLGCLVIVYLGQRVWPDYNAFPDADTAFLDVSRRIGGQGLFAAMAAALAVGVFGSAVTGQAGAARLMFGMGRAGVLPRRVFSHIDARSRQPTYNVIFVGLVTYAATLILDFEEAGELLNFGAFLAFMSVNLSAAKSLLGDTDWSGASRILGVIIPGVGFLSCAAIWTNLPAAARHVGFVWLGIGVLYQAIRTRGFRTWLE